MSITDKLVDETVTRTATDTDTVPAIDRTWQRLYRFQEELDAAKDLTGELSTTLRFARHECRADIAFWYSGPKTRTTQVSAVRQALADRDWCESLARAALSRYSHETAEGLVDGSVLGGLTLTPAAVAFVRLKPLKLGHMFVARFEHGESLGDEALPVLRFLAGSLHYHQKHLTVTRGLRASLLGIFKTLIQVADTRDQYASGHSERVAQIARRIGEEMRLPQSMISDLYLAGLLHDVGTIGVPDEVTHCPTKLTGEQMALMRRHVLIGDELLASAKHLDRLRPGIRNHHERWDGKGYPDGLRGDGIPLLARVVAVADACDALMSARRYRPPLSPPQIEAVFKRFAESQWDPQVVTAFLRCSKEIFPPIYPKGVGESAYYALSDVVSAEVERSTIFHPALDDGQVIKPAR